MANTLHDLLAVRISLAEAEKLEAQLKQKIQQRMGEASKATFGDAAEITWKKSKDSLVLDVAKLLSDKPELLKKYPLVKPGSRRFLISA